MAHNTKAVSQMIRAQFNDALVVQYSKNETIIDESKESDYISLIKDGYVKAYFKSKKNLNLLVIQGAGEIIPFNSLISVPQAKLFTYIAMTDVSILRSSKHELLNAIGKNSWLSQEMLNQAMNVIDIYAKRVNTLEIGASIERVVSEFLHLNERFGVMQNKGSLIDVPLTHQDIAEAVNMTRETVSRAVGHLIKEKIIIQREHYFIIINLKKLQSITG